MAAVHFFTREVSFKLRGSRSTARWIERVIREEKKRLIVLNYIFCSDEYLLSINQQYLKHDTYTDVITFDSSEVPEALEGDIFVSIDRVKANARKFEKPFDNELHRVLVHGVLHLLGYSDKSPREKTLMRKKEDAYLSLHGKS